MPATPRATLTRPIRHARPKVSLTTTPTGTPVRDAIRSRSATALASQSIGSRHTSSAPTTLDRSTPALAQTKPWWVSTIRTRSARTMRVVSSRTTWTMRESASSFAASVAAWAEGVTSERVRIRPSALETTFWATTTTSPVWRDPECSTMSAARSSPGWISGRPSTPRSSRFIRSARAGARPTGLTARRHPGRGSDPHGG